MNRIIAVFIILCVGIAPIFAQDGIIGGGFGSNDWVTIDALAPSAGSSQIITLTPNGTGDQYFRMTSGGAQQSPSASCSPGEDILISENIIYNSPNTNCTNGAWYFNCPNTTDNYVFKTPSTGGNQFILFRINGAVENINSVTQDLATIYPLQDLTITATVSGTGALATGQSVYLRYTTDSWSSSSVIEMTYSGSGEDYTGVIPAAANSPSNSINYYVFSSGNGLTISHNDADWYSINLNNNGGANYSYTVESEWTTNNSGDGSWDDPNMWDANAVPPANVPVHIQDNLILDMDATVSNIEIASGISFTASDASPRNLSILANGSIANNGTYIKNQETIRFLGDGNITGTCDFNNVQTNGGLNPGTASTISNVLSILPGGYITGNPFTYASGSTLSFNTSGNFDLFAGNLEWNNTNSPHHLEILSGTTLRLNNDINRSIGGHLSVSGNLIWNHDNFADTDINIAGNMTIENGGQFTISDGDDHNLLSYDVLVGGNIVVNSGGGILMNNDIGDDMSVAGNITNNGTLNSNNRLIILDGSSLQTLTGTFTGTSMFHYLETNNSAGIQLNDNIYIEDELRMTTGLIFPNSSDIIISPAGLALGSFSASNMVVPTSSGRMIKEYNSSGSFLFPIGDNTGTAEYSPVNITINSATFGANAFISAILSDEKHPNNPSTTDFLTRHWTIEPNDITGIDYDIDFTYVDADINGTEISIIEIKSNDGGSSWTQLGTVDDAANKIALTGQTSFSVFTGGDNAALPIELLSFEGEAMNQEVLLNWSTQTETNAAYFEIEHYNSNGEWVSILTKQAAGNSHSINNYHAVHEQPFAGTNYYRLAQIDFDGSRAFYGPVIAVEVDNLGYNSYNYENGNLDLFFNHASNEWADIRIFDLSGKLLLSKNQCSTASGVISMNLSSLEGQLVILQILGTNGKGKTYKIALY